MSTQSASVRFFDAQFARQVGASEFELNPFERSALPYVQGKVLDFGCGLGNLAVAAARQGCQVTAMDASPTAISHLGLLAKQEALRIDAVEAELSDYRLSDTYDTVVCIGLLMFLDCPHAVKQLEQLQGHLKPQGVLVLNTLVSGTTYMDMFDPRSHCLLSAQAWQAHFSGWHLAHCEQRDFAAPDQRIKSFLTLIARKPGNA